MIKIARNPVAVQTSRITLAYENKDLGKLLLPLVEKTIAAEGGTRAGSFALAPKSAAYVRATSSAHKTTMIPTLWTSPW